MATPHNEALTPPSTEISDTNSKILALEAENQALKQRLLANELVEEVKEKVSTWFGDKLKITLSLIALFGFATVASVYGVIYDQAKQTTEKVTVAEATKIAKQVSIQEVKEQAVNEVRKELAKEKNVIIDRITQTVRDDLAKDPVLLGRIAYIVEEMTKNGKKLEKGGFYVVVGSAQTQANLEYDKKLAEKQGFSALVCSSNTKDRYVLVISKQKDKFSLPASEATKVLQEAKSKIELFKQNQAFTLPQARAFFNCSQPKKS